METKVSPKNKPISTKKRALKKAQSKYLGKLLIVKVSANPDKETEIHQWLIQQQNRSGAIKVLIEQEIAGKKAGLLTNHNVLASITRHISRHSNEFSLFFVECNSQRRRDAMITAMTHNYGSKVITANYDDFERNEHVYLDEWLLEVIKRQKTKNVIAALNIINFENLLLENTDKVFNVVNAMNWRRSNFKELAVPIFFWTSSNALSELASKAADFYDWHTDVLMLNVD